MEANLGEIIVLNKAFNEREHTNILSYLSRKWQLTSSVDSDGDGDFDSFDDFPCRFDYRVKTRFIQHCL